MNFNHFSTQIERRLTICPLCRDPLHVHYGAPSNRGNFDVQFWDCCIYCPNYDREFEDGPHFDLTLFRRKQDFRSETYLRWADEHYHSSDNLSKLLINTVFKDTNDLKGRKLTAAISGRYKKICNIK